MTNIIRALIFLRDKFHDQPFDGQGAVLLEHPLEVLWQLTNADITDETVLISGLLHDVLLYSDTTPDAIEEAFGQQVRALVEELYYDKSLPKEELQHLLITRTPDLSPGAQVIALADITANLMDEWVISDFVLQQRLAFSETVAELITEPNQRLLESFNTALEMKKESAWSEINEVGDQEMPSDIEDIQC